MPMWGSGGELLIETHSYITRACEGFVEELNGLIGKGLVFLARKRLEEGQELFGVAMSCR